jgi:hypothetical protein
MSPAEQGEGYKLIGAASDVLPEADNTCRSRFLLRGIRLSALDGNAADVRHSRFRKASSADPKKWQVCPDVVCHVSQGGHLLFRHTMADSPTHLAFHADLIPNTLIVSI